MEVAKFPTVAKTIVPELLLFCSNISFPICHDLRVFLLKAIDAARSPVHSHSNSSRLTDSELRAALASTNDWRAFSSSVHNLVVSVSSSATCAPSTTTIARLHARAFDRSRACTTRGDQVTKLDANNIRVNQVTLLAEGITQFVHHHRG
jgi:hypothetical protein